MKAKVISDLLNLAVQGNPDAELEIHIPKKDGVSIYGNISVDRVGNAIRIFAYRSVLEG